MNGKCKKMGFGLSGLMCAGVLFSCVLTSEAGGIEREAGCGHTSITYVGSHESYTSCGDSVHDVYKVKDYVCNDCQQELHVYEKIGQEEYDFTEYWDSVENCWAENCGKCNHTYYYH